MIVSISEVSKKYGLQLALDNVSFQLQEGQITGFIGPNGAGKSTMMKIMTGYLPPTSGNIYYDELNIFEHTIAIQRIVGYLPENNPLYLNMYVKEYLSFVAGMYGLGKKAKARVDEMIELTGLVSECKKKIGSLSKGYRQRVGIAQALIHDPKVLILDEPTSGLDPNQIIEIRNLIRAVASKKCVFLSTHIMQEVEAICDRIILINKGKIMADKPTSMIKEGSHTIIVEFNTPVEENFFSFDGISSIMCNSNQQWLVECNEGIDIREEIFNKAVEMGIKVLSLQKKEKPLEEVFHELTQ
jgi:ABC-2 type transport system ATP-binding protein